MLQVRKFYPYQCEWLHSFPNFFLLSYIRLNHMKMLIYFIQKLKDIAWLVIMTFKKNLILTKTLLTISVFLKMNCFNYWKRAVWYLPRWADVKQWNKNKEKIISLIFLGILQQSFWILSASFWYNSRANKHSSDGWNKSSLWNSKSSSDDADG